MRREPRSVPYSHSASSRSQNIDCSLGRGAPTVLPRELSLDQATAVQGLHGLDDVEVLDGDLGVLLEVVAVQGE